MKWTRTFLMQTKGQKINFQESVSIDASTYDSFFNLKDLKEVVVEGSGHYDSENECLFLNLKVSGKMYIPCARSLELVEYPFQTEDELTYCYSELLDDDSIAVIGSEIDTTEAVRQIIMYAIPLKVVKEGIDPVNVEAKEDTVDPRLAKLKDLFNDQEVD